MLKRLEIQNDGVVKLFSFSPKTGILSCEYLEKDVLSSGDIETTLRESSIVTSDDLFVYNPVVPNSYSAPFKIYIDITDSCQLNCKHCLTKSLNNHNELNLETLASIADECARLGVFYVKLGGGEPLLHKEFNSVVELFRNKGIFISVSTNGILVNDAVASFLRENQVRTTVSVEGPKELDESIRGKGHFDIAMRALECLKRHDVDVALRVTLTRYMLNVSYIKELLSLAESYGVKLKVSYCRPAGSAINTGCMVEASDKNKYWDVIKYLNSPENRNSVILDEGMMISQPEVLDWLLYENRICGAANRSMHINSKGQISPCVFMGYSYCETDSQYMSGDILKYWSETKGSTFRCVREVQMPCECTTCRRKCKYECLATRLFFSGDFLGQDPNCLRRLYND